MRSKPNGFRLREIRFFPSGEPRRVERAVETQPEVPGIQSLGAGRRALTSPARRSNKMLASGLF
jgi:hypothetical protein